MVKIQYSEMFHILPFFYLFLFVSFTSYQQSNKLIGITFSIKPNGFLRRSQQLVILDSCKVKYTGEKFTEAAQNILIPLPSQKKILDIREARLCAYFGAKAPYSWDYSHSIVVNVHLFHIFNFPYCHPNYRRIYLWPFALAFSHC